MRKTVGLIAVIFLLMLCGMAAAEVAAQDNQYWEEGRIPVTGNAGGRISAKSDIFTGFSLMNAGSEGETLPAPANVHWKEGSTATAAWDAVEGAEYYKVKVYVYYDGEEIGNTEIGNTETGTADTEIDVQQEIYVILGENEPEAVQVAYSAAAGKYEAENEIVYGPESVVSDKIRYIPGNVIRLDVPDAYISREGNLVITHDVHADSYYYQLYEGTPFHSGLWEIGSGTIDAGIVEEGIISYPLGLQDRYVGEGYEGYNVDYEIMLQACTQQEGYINSGLDWIEGINWYWLPVKAVESVSLSPDEPLLYIGHKLSLGKTITPEDAYYDAINWISSNDSVVSVSDVGQVTGISSGTAAITATIGEVSASVPVTVYTISSNVDEEDQQEVTDTAGTIIDDIGNNDNPDLSNTDVDPDETEELQEQIHEGMERGDTFRTDILMSKRDWAHFKKYQDQIRQWLDNGVFAGGFDINVEVYHQDGQGNKYHIANITQFGDEIGFTVTADSLTENAPGQLKDLRMIRIHDGVLEVIPVTVNEDGNISVKSDKFSEFILICEAPVFGTPDFVMPAALTTIEESAFEGMTNMTAVDAHNCTAIDKDAFKDCARLSQIRLAKDCSIDPGAFDTDHSIYVFAPAGDSTEEFCKGDNNLVFVPETAQE